MPMFSFYQKRERKWSTKKMDPTATSAKTFVFKT